MSKIAVKLETETIKLDQFLKWAEVVSSGGEAKHLIKEGEVKVNGEISTQRGKAIKKGDTIAVGEYEYLVQ
ncbi:ribosome-associated protein [Desulfitispora alkaliphila]|uniref:RNA-binding S4 domain-containing protein n=1 Tax=Desulfitispora alkaliphila TaxID=622674 RepID=UPI003D263308